VPRVEGSKPIAAVGVGRADYSQNIEQSVEPIITSWQREYQHYEEFTVGAGASVTKDIDIESATVAIIYDYYLSSFSSVVLDLDVEALLVSGAYVPIAMKSALQAVDIRLAKGFPMFRRWRITVTNHGGADADCHFSAHGIVTDETMYTGVVI
jgi:hypothetical protein